MKMFCDENVDNLLRRNKLNNFSAIWSLKDRWFEPPNHRRGGWSGVVKKTLQSPECEVDVFIKRQHDYRSRTLFHPLIGIPTYQRELSNIQRLRRLNIPTLKPLFFSKNKRDAILITQALDGYQPLDQLEPSLLKKTDKQALLAKLAMLLRELHRCHYMHNCCYPKHLFVRKQCPGKWTVRIIDLEKMRRCLFVHSAMIRDLSCLNKRLGTDWSARDRLFFFRSYRGEEHLTRTSKILLRRILRRATEA